jgi:4-alpha-glucanotransferase
MNEPGRWGIETGYRDAGGTWREPPSSTVDAILDVMGAAGAKDPPPWDGMVVVAGAPTPLPAGRWRVELEDGGTFDAEGVLPVDLPLGYHHVSPSGGQGTERPHRLIVGPARCWPPPRAPIWGWSVQLYAARSVDSWGMGDLGDLRRLAAWSAAHGARVLMINPLHAGSEPSPYFASSRCFRDPRYLRVLDVPGASAARGSAAAVQALNDERLIDRDAVWALKSPVLERAFAGFGGDPGFDRYRAGQGRGLEGYAAYCALAELHGPDWRDWPGEVGRPDAAGVAAFVGSSRGARRVTYHAWLQWLLDQQLGEAAAQGPGFISDVAIGARDEGADAWIWQDCLATGMRIGAPPDEFNALGQDWALPPFDPWRLRAAGYEPFILAVRNALRHAGAIRIDHVMGLFRQFWIPPGATPSEGAYVRYPHSDLLSIVALESHRAAGFVIGEDLGTVEDLVRGEMAARGVLSYRLLWFEPEPPGRWPRQALGAVTTHDLPTVAGLWTGRDLEAQRQIGVAPNEASTRAMRGRLREWCGVGDGAPVEQVILRVHELLAGAPCAVVAATLDDACAVWERPNMPGTTDQWPNWCLALPLPLDEIERSELALAIAERLNRRRP